MVHENFGFSVGYLVVLLAAFSLFVALTGLALAALGRLLKGFAGLAGKWFLFMAVVPWILWTVGLILASFVG